MADALGGAQAQSRAGPSQHSTSNSDNATANNKAAIPNPGPGPGPGPGWRTAQADMSFTTSPLIPILRGGYGSTSATTSGHSHSHSHSPSPSRSMSANASAVALASSNATNATNGGTGNGAEAEGLVEDGGRGHVKIDMKGKSVAVENRGNEGTVKGVLKHSMSRSASDVNLERMAAQDLIKDPKVLEDVNRALRLKARREARRISGPVLSHSPLAGPSTVADPTIPLPPPPPAQQSLPFPSPPVPPLPRDSPTPRAADNSFQLDSDSIITPGAENKLIPVPVASPAGSHQLDWTRAAQAGEKHKRSNSLTLNAFTKTKRTKPGVAVPDEQFQDRLQELSARASAETLEKVRAVKNELFKRYSAIFTPLLTQGTPWNPLDVLRWQVADMQPHPSFPIRTDRTSTSSSRRRSPWMLSAASIEDFVERSKSQISPVATHATQSPAVSLRSDSEGASVYSILGTGSPARFSIERYGKSSRPSSLHSVHEDENEEGPIPERREEGPASRRVSAEIPVESTSGLKPPTDESGRRSWRNSLSGISKHGHSPRNSLHNLFSTITHDSPSSSKHSLADIAKRLKIPGHSDREGPLEIPEILTEPLSKEGSDISTGPPADQDENKLTVTVPTMTYLDTLSMKSRRSRASSRATPDVALPPRLPRLRRTKTSPYMKPVDLPGTEKKEKGALNVVRETHEELRYQRRALFLQTVAEDNHRIRRELQTTAQRISEYVESQNLSALDDTGTMKFPNNVLEAIAYDPITDVITPHGSAAYVAVEETQDRIRRQSRVVEEHLRLLQTSHAPSDRRREELADRLRVALKQLERLDGIQSSERHRLEKIEAQLPRLENLQADATLKFHAVYAATASEYPEMQHIAVMIDKYIPLLQRLTNLFWIYVGPFLDLLGTYIAAPIMKRYGPDYIFPDISDFALVPIFETEITQGDPANFKLTFPRRTFLHWLVALIFDVSSFIVCKVISDIAGFVSWIADFSIPRIQFPLLSWTSWAVFSAVRLTLFSMAVFWGATGFFVPGLLLWWTFWYLTSIYGRLSKPIYLYLATTIVLGLIAIGAFTWWVRYSSPLWEVARPILHFHPYLGGPLYPEQPDPL